MILTLLGCLQAVGPKIAADDTDTATQDCSQLWYGDHDADGVGAGAGIAACEAPNGFAGETGDCNDDSANIHPAAIEHCDGLDEDCDGTQDNDAIDQTERWPDVDGDGFGDDATALATVTCPTPETTSTPGDCDDDDVERSPQATEICQDGIDNDCDGVVDACTTLTWESGRTSAGEAGTRLGATVALGDFDGDNVVDAIAGAPGDVRGGQNAGAVVLLQNKGLQGPTALILGVPDQFLGASLTVADVDADGRDDILASGDWTGDATLAFAGGGVLSLVGMAGRLLLADLDGDGADEAVLGSLDAAGSVCIVAGPLARGEVVDVARGGARCASGESTGDAAGYALAAGDFDGDGSADLAIGAPAAANAAGRVYILPHPLSADTSLADAATQLNGAAAWARAGVALQAGDLDGNGVDDLVVGAEGDGPDGSGVAWLQYGPLAPGESTLSGDAIRGETRLDYAGVSLDLADVDDDGWLDLLLGAPLYGTTDEGAAYLVFGPITDGDLAGAGETYATARVAAGADGSWTGWSVSAARGTVAVGAPAASENSGAAAVFSVDRRDQD